MTSIEQFSANFNMFSKSWSEESERLNFRYIPDDYIK